MIQSKGIQATGQKLPRRHSFFPLDLSLEAVSLKLQGTGYGEGLPQSEAKWFEARSWGHPLRPWVLLTSVQRSIYLCKSLGTGKVLTTLLEDGKLGENGQVTSFILDTLNLGPCGTSSEQCWKDIWESFLWRWWFKNTSEKMTVLREGCKVRRDMGQGQFPREI